MSESMKTKQRWIEVNLLL